MPSRKASSAGFSRTQLVWGTFVGAMTVVCGLLMLADGSLNPVSGAPMLSSGQIGQRSSTNGLFELSQPLDEARWKAIVIHHSGSPAGSAETLHRLHQNLGLDELGYHFVIGNGNGMEEGTVHVGRRWLEQRSGVHAVGPQSEWFNESAIAICVIGNGESRPFSDRQMESLIPLVRQLQTRLRIPAPRVVLHRDIAEVGSPGRFFPESEFQAGLIVDPR